MSATFDRLSPALQYHIANSLGFDALRPVQESSVEAILDGHNCVILAPTAGGKTEAAIFPLLSLMDTEEWRPVSVIYVAPIRALLNNQEERLARYAGLIGRTAFKWHGDVTTGERRRFIEDPADILLTTPESLEVMLMSRRVPAERLFQGLRAVVIDEVHAFVPGDRGGHLAAVLERLSRFCGKDVQRIGLSATVGNPDDILRWLAGSSRREGRIVNPVASRVHPAVKIDWVATVENAARVIAKLHPGKKRLVFVDSRRKVEALGQELRALGTETFVIHASLALDERQAAEEAFENGRDCVIVATSALELGIDIGDLDHVLQVDAPGTVAAFLQRMGRTGRREGATPNCTFLATEPEGLLRAAAVVELWRDGFVESLAVPARCPHLLAHQVLALSLQIEGGVPVSDWWAWISQATPFQLLNDADRGELLEHMKDENILFESGGRLSLGSRGEKLYGWRNFAELYSVFSTPETLKVLWGGSELGSIDLEFALGEPPDNLTFVLGARAWRAVSIDWGEAVVRVEPIGEGKLARWEGRPQHLSRELCRAMRRVLVSQDVPGEWSRRAAARMTELRLEHDLDPERTVDLVTDANGFRLWTFGGGKANRLLARTLQEMLGDTVTSDNLYLGFRHEAASSEVAIRRAFTELHESKRPSRVDSVRLAAGAGRGRLTKFQPCLTERLESEYLADLLMDDAAARQTVEDVTS